jgi:hypothetical protein
VTRECLVGAVVASGHAYRTRPRVIGAYMHGRFAAIRRLSRVTLQAAILGMFGGCSSATQDAEPLALVDVTRMARARDFFTLRDRAARSREDGSPASLVAQAMLRHAFNEPERSNASIRAALATPGLPDSLRFRLRALRVTNYFRTFDYPSGLAAATEALADTVGADSSSIEELRNMRRIVHALADVSPQTLTRAGATRFRMERGHIPVMIGDSARSYIFDTGANLSTMARSEAMALGLQILDADIDVGSSTDIHNTADLAVAPRMRIGTLEYRNVVFLVFDDRLLSFPGFRIQGIVGFPVISAMGEIRVRRDGDVIVPSTPPVRRLQNLALSGMTPLTEVEWSGRANLCRVDTGASDTEFYEPFYRANAEAVRARGVADSAESGGVGGIRRLPIFVLRDVRVGIGDTSMVLPRAAVNVQSLSRAADDNYLYCNVGRDVFDKFAEYVFNFREMTFLLR